MAKSKNDLPLYLFHQGTNHRAYTLMGAHPAKKGRGAGINFTVWAPCAQSVAVVGDFNDWDPTAHPLKKITPQGVWSGFVARLENFDTYKYAITTQKGELLLKSDPYAFHTETPPFDGSKIYDLSSYEWGDTRWLKERKNQNHLCSPINIYEVHLGSWMRSPDNEVLNYREIADKLVDYVKKMGYTHIELLPVTEHPFDGSWGYQSTGYFAPTSRFGVPDDFRYLVDRCHQSGIGVILDWVPGHFPKDAYGLALFDGTCLYEHPDPLRGEQPQWGTKVFDFARYEVISFLISSAMFWIEEYHIDGIRVDAVASMLYLDYGRERWLPNIHGGKENLEAVAFLQRLNSAILTDHPDVMMIAEESTAWPQVTKPPYVGGLGFNLKWNMGWMNDMLSYTRLDPKYRSYHHDKLTFSMMYAFSENYMLPISHDEVVHGKGSLIGKMPGDQWTQFAGVRAFLGYMYAHPGKKLSFMGNEFGQFKEWDYRKQLDWGLLATTAHQDLLVFVQELNHFYRTNPPLWQADTSWEGFSWLMADNADEGILAFRRIDDDNNQIIAIFNFSPTPYRDYRLGVPLPGRYHEVLNSDTQRFGGKGNINPLPITALPIKADCFPHSIKLNVPPMAAVFFRYIRD